MIIVISLNWKKWL